MKRLKVFTSVLAFLGLFHGLVWAGPPLRATEVYETFVKLPQRGKEDPCAIEVVPMSRWTKYPDALGYYNAGADQMWIRANQDRLLFRETVAHEYGHHLYFQVCSTEDILSWNTFWNENILLMPGPYAKKSASEGWAECYAIRYVGAESSYYKPGTKLDPLIAQEVDRIVAQRKAQNSKATVSLAELVCRTR